jgi:hypothetical protein
MQNSVCILLSQILRLQKKMTSRDLEAQVMLSIHIAGIVTYAAFSSFKFVGRSPISHFTKQVRNAFSRARFAAWRIIDSH